MELEKGRSCADAVDLTDSPPASPPPKRARMDNGKARTSTASASSSSASRAPPQASSYFEAPVIASSSRTAPAKRPRESSPTATVALDSFRLPKIVSSTDAAAPGSAFGNYNLPPPSQALPPSTQRTAEQERRHQAWQLLAGNVMPRRRSLALDEAAAADARRAAGIDPAEEDGDAEEGVDGSTTEAAAKLRSKYTATAAPVKKGRKKKEEELGPSGMTYTPLEKQYMEIKAKWPDVLLFMEGGRCVR